MKKNWVVILIFAFCILNFLGCAGMFKKEKDLGVAQILEPQATLKFSDIPIPTGFKALPQESYSFESSGIRVGLLKYQGKANPDQVVNFYKEQMGMYNWDLVNIIEYGQRMLNFERDNESCIVTLLPKGKNTTITISLGPKSQIGAKKAAKPVK